LIKTKVVFARLQLLRCELENITPWRTIARPDVPQGLSIRDR
jgi:hypothetical protein